jgi:probable rRNA maturation factor
VKITIKNLQKKITLNPKRIKAAILKTLSSVKKRKSGEINVCFVDDKKIRALNLKFLRKDEATDVLTFDISQAPDKKNIFADIVISTDTALRNAGIFNTGSEYELTLYCIHGVLHILGYDDKNTSQRKAMHKKAVQILSLLNITCP